MAEGRIWCPEADKRATREATEKLGYSPSDSLFLSSIKWGLVVIAVLVALEFFALFAGESHGSMEDWPRYYEALIVASIGAGYLFHKARDKAWWACYSRLYDLHAPASRDCEGS